MVKKIKKKGNKQFKKKGKSKREKKREEGTDPVRKNYITLKLFNMDQETYKEVPIRMPYTKLELELWRKYKIGYYKSKVKKCGIKMEREGITDEEMEILMEEYHQALGECETEVLAYSVELYSLLMEADDEFLDSLSINDWNNIDTQVHAAKMNVSVGDQYFETFYDTREAINDMPDAGFTKEAVIAKMNEIEIKYIDLSQKKKNN